MHVTCPVGVHAHVGYAPQRRTGELAEDARKPFAGQNAGNFPIEEYAITI